MDRADTVEGDHHVSAAEKVFATPELLEMILLEVSDAPQPRRDIPGPAKPLFVLQRVNSAFQATITRSTTIQRRMWLKPYPKGSTMTAPYAQLHWLSIGLGLPGFNCGLYVPDPDAYTRDGTDFCANIIHDPPENNPDPARDRYGRHDHPAKRRPEASWRKMKLHGTEESKELTLYLRRDNRRFENRTFKFQYADGMTMGQLDDGLQKLVPFLPVHRDVSLGGPRTTQLFRENTKSMARKTKAFFAMCDRADFWT